MDPMDDLVQFLRARLDDDAATATAAGGGPWTDEEGFADVDPWFELPTELANHALRHDPTRVLAEVNAKRRMVELHAKGHECSTMDQTGEIDPCTWVPAGETCTTLDLLALPYADHPDYKDAWRP